MFHTSDDEPVGLGTLFVRWGIDGFALGAGAGGSVIMINWLFRVGVTGDQDREREEEARRFLEVHGYWPDERPPPPRPAGPGA
jgi:hypothetical protein